MDKPADATAEHEPNQAFATRPSDIVAGDCEADFGRASRGLHLGYNEVSRMGVLGTSMEKPFAERLAPGLSLLMLGLDCFGLLLLGVWVFFLPTFSDGYASMNVELPFITQLMLAVPAPVYLLLLSLSALALILKQSRWSDRRKVLNLNVWAGVGILLFCISFWVILYLPMFATITALD